MTTTINLLDKYRAVCLLQSDNAAALSLGLTRSALSLWRNGKSHANATAVERMCQATGQPLARWLPMIEAERARTAGDRRVWLRLAQGITACGLLIAAAYNLPTLYIMSTIELGTLFAAQIQKRGSACSTGHSTKPRSNCARLAA
jgi:transcriptional regulator with XRE-family HTH domain